MNNYRDTSTSSTSDMSASRVRAEFQDKANEALGQAQQVASEQLDQLQGMIRRNPLAAAGIAAGIGFFLAVIARR